MSSIVFQRLLYAATTNQVLAGFILVVITMILYVTLKITETKANLPPGPTSLPIIGNLHQVGAFGGRQDKAIRLLRKQYGDIYTLKLGTATCVDISSYKLIKEALVTHGDAFLGRPVPNPCFRIPAFKGVTFSDGEGWNNHRRFALQHLRDLGFGKVTMEESIHHEIGFLFDAIREKSGEPSDIGLLVGNAVANITCVLILGHRFRYTNNDFQEMIKRVDEFGKADITAIGRYFPCLLYLPIGFTTTRKYLENVYAVREFLRRKVKEHEASFNPNNTRDLIDVYIKGGLELQGPSEGSIFEEGEVVQVMFDMFAAGTETTTAGIRWVLLYLMINQDVQERMRQEIEGVVGNNRLPSMKDRAQLHYTEAVLTEVLRLSNLVLAPPRRVTETVNICGYDIPANTVILPDFTSVTLDENEFPDANEFCPQRFLDENGHFAHKKQDRLITFGMGKRECLGKSLAKTELFLFIASMVQHFKFYLPETEPIPSMVGSDGLVHCPDTYQLYALEN